jgi:hypothetical protein
LFPTHHALHTWLHLTSFSSRRWKSGWRDEDLILLRKSKRKRRQY